MTTKSSYLVALPLVAILIIAVAAGAYFYYEYSQVSQSRNQYVDELQAANTQYNQLATNYNASLALYNETFSLLVRAVAVVNTSQQIYIQASTELSQLWNQYLSLKPASSSLYKADILINFGNGTSRWYNGTEVQPGWNMYTLTVVLSHGNLQAQWSTQYQEHFISGIDGVSNSQSMYWFIWTYNRTALWQVAPVGADDLPVYNGSVFAWTFCGVTSSYAPTCTP